MDTKSAGSRWGLGLVGLGLGVVVGLVIAQNGETPVNPELRTLDADLWVQTAAEYRASCLQAYELAKVRLDANLKDKKVVCDEKDKARTENRPPAVILDLDETVLDNAAYQSFLFDTRQGYSDATWKEWEANHPGEVRLIPGAKEFLDHAHRQGVEVFYISNRLQEYQAQAAEILKNHGVNVDRIEKRLLLRREGESGSKDSRRANVSNSHRVVLLVGDNLRDFSERFAVANKNTLDSAARATALEKRLQEVDATRDRWGNCWIVLPNPVYGEWRDALGKQPTTYLRPPMKPR